MPIPEAEGHARGNKGGPYGCEGDEEYPYAIPEGWLCWHVVDRKIIHGGDWAGVTWRNRMKERISGELKAWAKERNEGIIQDMKRRWDLQLFCESIVEVEVGQGELLFRDRHAEHLSLDSNTDDLPVKFHR